MLAHKAEHEGVICVEKIAGLPNVHPMNKSMIPGCTYCHPQVASVGLTEAKAKELGRDIRVGRFNFNANGKAIALGEAEGFIKTVFDARTGELLGAHMVGAEVTELIQGYTIGKTAELVEADFMHTRDDARKRAGGLWQDVAYVMAKGTQDFTPDPRNERILINVNGVLTPRAQAVVSVFDSGFMLGDGVWEGI
eukprot:gene36567-59699_t